MGDTVVVTISYSVAVGPTTQMVLFISGNIVPLAQRNTRRSSASVVVIYSSMSIEKHERKT
jgi:hypothetical protein